MLAPGARAEMPDISLIRADELSPTMTEAWQSIQNRSADLRHPMLSAKFVQCVARHGTAVEIAVIGSGAGIVGFFPFQRERRAVANPVGYRLNDYQAALLAPDVSIDARRLLSSCGLRVWRFDHLITSQPGFASGHFVLEDSPYIDLSRGFDAYLQAISGRARWRSHSRNEQRMTRDLGPVRFEFHTDDTDVYRTLLEWKTAQLHRNRRRCVFDWDWVRDTLEELRSTQDAGCSGTLSALYAGDRLAAAHLGLRSRDVLHWWITAYDGEIARYSPGALLLTRAIEAAAGHGVTRIDLGKGNELYKSKLQSGATPLATGVICDSGWKQTLHRSRFVLQERVRSSSLAGPAKRVSYWLEARRNKRAS